MKTIIKNKKYIIAIILLVLLVVGVLIYYLINSKKEEFIIGKTLQIQNASDYLVEYDNGDYYLRKANKDISFEVSGDDKEIKYSITDLENNVIETKLKKEKDNYIIQANKDYEVGETYVLNLENGTLVDEKLKDIHTLYFTIIKPNSNTQVLNDSVIKVNKDTIIDIKKDDTFYTIISNKEFNKDDILYYQNENEAIAFKVNEINRDNGNYKIKTASPTLEEIFKELDIYGEFNLSINDFITNEELKDYIKVAIVKNGLLDNLVPRVNAESNFDVNIETQKDGSAKVIVSIMLSGGDKSVFKKALENHDIKLDIEFLVKLKAHSNINFFQQDIGANIDIELGSNFKIISNDEQFLEFKKELENNDEVNVSLAKKKLEEINLDDSKDEKSLGHVTIPTPIMGLNVKFEVDFLTELELALKTALAVKSDINISFGYNNKGFYKNFNIRAKESDYSILGKVEAKIGFEPKVNISFLEVMEAGIKAPLGFYGEGQINYMKSAKKNEFDGKLELGAFISAGVYADFHIWKLNIAEFEATYEKKVPIILLEGKVKDICEEKLLNGDFSCYVGTYSSTNSSNTLTISSDGKFETEGKGKGKYQSIKKENDGSYYIVVGSVKTETGYDIESGYYIYPANLDDKGKIRGLTLSDNLDISKIRIMYCTNVSCEYVYQEK